MTRIHTESTTDPADAQIALTAMDRPLTARRPTVRRIVAAIIVLLLAAAGAGVGYLMAAVPTTTIEVGELTISEVSAGAFIEYIPVTGTIEPQSTVYLDAIEGGQVGEVFTAAGRVVEAGDPLVRLTNTNLQLEVIGREAQLTEQLNNLSTARLAFEQNRLNHARELIEIDFSIDKLARRLRQLRALQPTGSIARSEIEDLESEITYEHSLREAIREAQRIDAQSGEAQIAMLQEAAAAMTRNLEITRGNLASLVVTAPIAGQLTVFEAHVGESKPAGARIGQIDSIDAFRLGAFIDEYYLSRVRAGQAATAAIDGHEFDLRVTNVLPEVRDRQFEIELGFVDEPPASIRRGQTVRLNLEIGQPASTLRVTNGEFFDDTGGTWVFVVDAAGRSAQRRQVTLGRRNPDRIEVVAGLTAGDRIVTSSYRDLLRFERLILIGAEQ